MERGAQQLPELVADHASHHDTGTSPEVVRAVAPLPDGRRAERGRDRAHARSVRGSVAAAGVAAQVREQRNVEERRSAWVPHDRGFAESGRARGFVSL